MTGRWMTSQQCAEHLGLTRSGLEKLVHRRRIPFTRIGDTPRSPLRFDRHAIDEWMAERAVPVGGVTPEVVR